MASSISSRASTWFEAPSWTAHKIRDIPFTSGYVDNFSDLPVDVDGDGYTDVVQIAYFARKIVWLKNPGKTKNPWAENEIEAIGPTEFAFLVDLNNDGKALEILPQFTGAAASPVLWYELQDHKWVRHVVSPQSYGHGIGVGDLNGDGRNDILTAKGWLESPADPRAAGDWVFHASDWGQQGTSEFGFMHVLDVNGDGRKDVVTTIAHANGVLWIEQGADGKWTSRMIDNTWSQAHTSALADLTGDGQVELITGKRYHARNAAADATEREPLGLYWYRIPADTLRRGVAAAHHRLRRARRNRSSDDCDRHRPRRRHRRGDGRQDRRVPGGESVNSLACELGSTGFCLVLPGFCTVRSRFRTVRTP